MFSWDILFKKVVVDVPNKRHKTRERVEYQLVSRKINRDLNVKR